MYMKYSLLKQISGFKLVITIMVYLINRCCQLFC